MAWKKWGESIKDKQVTLFLKETRPTGRASNILSSIWKDSNSSWGLGKTKKKEEGHFRLEYSMIKSMDIWNKNWELLKNNIFKEKWY